MSYYEITTKTNLPKEEGITSTQGDAEKLERLVKSQIRDWREMITEGKYLFSAIDTDQKTYAIISIDGKVNSIKSRFVVTQ